MFYLLTTIVNKEQKWFTVLRCHLSVKSRLKIRVAMLVIISLSNSVFVFYVASLCCVFFYDHIALYVTCSVANIKQSKRSLSICIASNVGVV